MSLKKNHSEPSNSPNIADRESFYQGFEIPGQLYGRNREIEALFTAYDRVCQGQREIMLVSGHAGMGKTSLIREFYSQLRIRQKNLQASIFDLQSGVRFIFGSFDRFRRNIPYSALTKAFQELTRHILAESATRVERWRKKIMDAVGPNGQIIIDLVPNIERIIGPQPESPPAGSQNRFNLVFQKFIWVLYQPEHPLVIFLDDLQWADAATLRLIEQMFTDEKMQHLFLIGTYDSLIKDVRKEMNADPLPMTLRALRKGGTIINQLALSPLKLEHIEHAVASVVPGWKPDTRNLKAVAEMVLHKTAGNPFFVSQLMKTLLKNTESVPENFIPSGLSLQISALPGNITELMFRKLKELPEPTQQVLRLAACMGNHFDLNSLSAVYKKSEAETFKHLLPAINEGFVREPEFRGSRFRFRHDCIQEAACALLDEDQKKGVCLRIGRLLLAKISDEAPKVSGESRTSPKVSNKSDTSQEFEPVSDQGWTDKHSERIFELAGIMNMGYEMLTDDREKLELLKLNLKAGKKAKSLADYSAALQYLKVGMDDIFRAGCEVRGARDGHSNLTSSPLWTDHHELAFDLYKERAEVEYLNGNFDQSEAYVELILDDVKSAVKKTELYNLLIVQKVSQSKYEEAIQIGRTALHPLGIALPGEGLKLSLQTATDLELAKARKKSGRPKYHFPD